LLWRLTGTYVWDPASREDLYQEILIALWKALPTFRGEASLRTFVLRVAHNRGSTFRWRTGRRERRELPMEAGEGSRVLVTAGAATSDPAVAADLSERVHRAVRTLPEGLALVASLRLEGLTAREIGAVLGLSINNVEVRLHRARTRLRAILDPEDFR
jgi:RNA polymerase sigma-70 factor (ECF subfamily)